MKINSLVNIPIKSSGFIVYEMSKWLSTHVGIQAVSWDWVYKSEHIHVGFYNEYDATVFKLRFEL
jgi:hypothetical protein